MANSEKRNDPEILTTRKGEMLMQVPGIDENGKRTTFYIMLNHDGPKAVKRKAKQKEVR